VSHSYNKTVTASGGTSPYSFIVMSGSLPPGLTLTSKGVLSGTPTSAGIFTLAIQARDGYGRLGTRQYNLTIALPTISLGPSTLPNATVSRTYSKNITAGGGTSPYSFSVTNGSLPPELTLTSSGVLSGTPTSAGSFVFAIEARDQYGLLGTRQYNLTIALPTVSMKSIDGVQSNGGAIVQQDRYSQPLR
jgi:hypothetical protein